MHMADTKALFTERFDAARTAFTKGDEPAAAESLHAAIAVARTDPSLRRELASALFHLGTLSRKFGRAGGAEAEPLLTEALSISEGLFGREHAALAPLLNELGRLHIQRSQYAGAADVLERLLAIARAKGEETADVATALAGLAVVKRKLGDDASAEALFRDALRLREKLLEPNHAVTVATLEHLADTCAARGNFDEALALFRRALTAREVALGPGHSTVEVTRSRVNELELQAAVADYTAVAAAAKAARPEMPTPAGLKSVPDSAAAFKRVPDVPVGTLSAIVPSPINSKKLDFLDEPEPRVLFPAALARARGKTPPATAAVAAAPVIAPSIEIPSASHIPISPSESAPPSEVVSGLESNVPHRDAVLADVAHSSVATDDTALRDWRSTIEPVQADLTELARRQSTVFYASVGVAAFAIVGLLVLRPRAGVGAPASTAMVVAQGTAGGPVVAPALTKTGFTATGGAAMVNATLANSRRSASASPAPAQPEKHAPESAPSAPRLPRIEVQMRPIKIPNVGVPSISTPSVDAIMQSATERQRASDSGPTVPTPSAVERPEVEKPVIPARIIGRVPEPTFPEALRSRKREGEVVVRFIVNELGTVDVASMIVERSDHDLFTEAVREILPRFRFEPARTQPPESKPVARWVSIPFRFATKQ